MTKTTEHRSYGGSVADLSRHGRSSASRALFGHPGFTLVEVVVAAAILLILLIGLAGMFARGVTGFKQAQLVTLAQNLAEFQVEDLKNLAPSVLHLLVGHAYIDVNYPYEAVADWLCDHTDAIEFDDRYCWAYDSGKLQTDFMVDGVISIGSRLAGTTAPPAIPTDTEVLLGSNIVVERYGVGQGTEDLIYWEDGEGWYYWDGETRMDLSGLPPSDTVYYYRIVLQKEAFPLFSRQVRIVQYDVDTPSTADPWKMTSVGSEYRDYHGKDDGTKFDYEITIWYKQNGVDRVLFRSGGTIAWPFISVNVDRRTA